MEEEDGSSLSPSLPLSLSEKEKKIFSSCQMTRDTRKEKSREKERGGQKKRGRETRGREQEQGYNVEMNKTENKK